MSSQPQPATQKRITVPQIRAYKNQQKIVALTAYSAPIAHILDEFLDLILIGDSTAMVGYQMPSTHGITIEQLSAHGLAVVRSTQRPCVVVDMPFGSYEQSPQQAFANAAKMIATSQANAVKFEGGVAMAETTRFLTERGIPVLAHVGLMPQHINTMGGFKAQGMSLDHGLKIIEDAVAQQQAGAFAIVIEGTAEPIAREITQRLSIPTIGIGASPACDGQILVTEDILNLTIGHKPKFAHQFADARSVIREGVANYASAVRDGTFPTMENCFGVKMDG